MFEDAIGEAKPAGKTKNEFHEIDVEEWGTSLQPMRHRGSVNFDKDVAGQIAVEVEVDGAIDALSSRWRRRRRRTLSRESGMGLGFQRLERSSKDEERWLVKESVTPFGESKPLSAMRGR